MKNGVVSKFRFYVIKYFLRAKKVSPDKKGTGFFHKFISLAKRISLTIYSTSLLIDILQKVCGMDEKIKNHGTCIFSDVHFF